MSAPVKRSATRKRYNIEACEIAKYRKTEPQRPWGLLHSDLLRHILSFIPRYLRTPVREVCKQWSFPQDYAIPKDGDPVRKTRIVWELRMIPEIGQELIEYVVQDDQMQLFQWIVEKNERQFQLKHGPQLAFIRRRMAQPLNLQLPIVYRSEAAYLKVTKKAPFRLDVTIARRGKLIPLQYLHHLGYRLDSAILVEAARGGNCAMMRWLEGIPGDTPGSSGAYAQKDKVQLIRVAAHHGHLSLVQKLRKEGVAFPQEIATCAAEGGNVDLLEWLKHEGVEFCAFHNALTAAKEGQLEALIWICKHGKPLSYATPELGIFTAAIKEAQCSILDWCLQQNFPNLNPKELVFKYIPSSLNMVKYARVLKWSLQNKILSAEDIAHSIKVTLYGVPQLIKDPIFADRFYSQIRLYKELCEWGLANGIAVIECQAGLKTLGLLKESSNP